MKPEKLLITRIDDHNFRIALPLRLDPTRAFLLAGNYKDGVKLVLSKSGKYVSTIVGSPSALVAFLSDLGFSQEALNSCEESMRK